VAYSAAFGAICGLDDPDEWSGNSVTATIPIFGLAASRMVMPWLTAAPGRKIRTLLEKLRHMDKQGIANPFIQVGMSTSGPAFIRGGARSNSLAWEIGWLSDPYPIANNVASSLRQVFNVANADALISDPWEIFDFAGQLEALPLDVLTSLASGSNGNNGF